MANMLKSLLEVIGMLYIINLNDYSGFGMNGETATMFVGLFSRMGGGVSKEWDSSNNSIGDMGDNMNNNTLRGNKGRIVIDTLYRMYLSIIVGVRVVPTMLTRIIDIYRNYALAVVMRDQEGDLLPESYKNRRNNMMGGYYITVITSIYVLSKLIVRLVSKFSFIALPIYISIGSFIVILIYNMGMWRELYMMVGVYRDKRRRGVYHIQSTYKRGIGGTPGGGKDLLRLGIKAAKAVGGGTIATAAGIEAANTIGKCTGYGEVGTKTMEDIAKKTGVHKSVRGHGSGSSKGTNKS